MLPEEALRIGAIIKIRQIVRNAYEVLVNEFALEQTATDEIKETVDFKHITLFGREKGDINDNFTNGI